MLLAIYVERTGLWKTLPCKGQTTQHVLYAGLNAPGSLQDGG